MLWDLNTWGEETSTGVAGEQGGRVCAPHHGVTGVSRLHWGEEQCTDPTSSRLGHASSLLPGALQMEQGGSPMYFQIPEAQHAVLCPDGSRRHAWGAEPGGRAVHGDSARPRRWERSRWLSHCSCISGPACSMDMWRCGSLPTRPQPFWSGLVAQ